MPTQQRTTTKAEEQVKASVNTSTPSQDASAKPLSAILTERAIPPEQWRNMDNLYPGASTSSKLLVFDYCRARKLDPMKKPCHIVPMEVKVGKNPDTGKPIYEWRDVIMPGIYELRTTAHRTGMYLGHTDFEYSPEGVKFKDENDIEIECPLWIRSVFKRIVPLPGGGHLIGEFPVRRFFREVATFKDGKLNRKWSESPFQMAEKNVEGAGLRETFPDEVGGMHAAEEMQGRVIDASEFSEIVERNSRGKPKAAEPVQAKADAVTWSEVPIDAITKRIDDLGLPMNQFLAQFEIGSVRELPLKFVGAAMEYLDALAAKQQPSEGGSNGQPNS